MSEVEFYRNNNVIITNSRFIVGQTTYAMNGITSVTCGKVDPSLRAGIIFSVIGVVMIAFINPIMSSVGALILFLAICWIKTRKTEYVVSLRTASGENRALESTDKLYIETIIRFLNEAIIYRG
ncbi:MAG: DUF6232 family protein [Zymomonas mobilis]|uniref:DUF6232 family protein n=1 Tax=Zymomonas mobilis TaxID=542 RepID=UPI0039E76585